MSGRAKLAALVLASATALVWPTSASAVSLGCGLPDAAPLWVEFSDGSVEFRQQVFGKPGVVVATNGVERAAEMRALGAHTVYWFMALRQMAGTPPVPKDPADTEQRANALYDRAVASTGCTTPVIILNELNGWYAATPWPANIAQYRSNVLLVMRVLAARGAKPFLLVPGPARGRKVPNVSGDAAQWWREVAAAGYIVRELYFNAPYIYNRGPIIGARLRRTAFREGLGQMLSLGIPADRLGVILGFHSGPGKGGREGLQPSSAWFSIIKQEALAAKQVAAELGISTIWSWGWGTFLWAPEGADPDKAAAACVYLWTRDPSLCDGPAVAGPDFRSSLTEGQIILPGSAHCDVNGEYISQATVDELTTVLGDRGLALRAALVRMILSGAAGEVSDADARAAERAAVSQNFGGDQDAYIAALAERGITRAAALAALADELRAQEAAVSATLADPGLPWANWLRRRQREALAQTICLNDEVPKAGPFSWAGALPFLTLPEPSLDIEASRRKVRRGESVMLSGTLSSSRAQEAVTVYALEPGSLQWEALGEAKLARDGTWTFDVTPRPGITTYRAASRSAISGSVSVRSARR